MKKANFSDICASTIFYSVYHCLLAICTKFGYESRNQECTFALVCKLIEEGKIKLEKELVDKLASFEPDKHETKTSIELREQYQYGTELSLDDNLYKEMIELVKDVLFKTKVIIEE